MAQSSDVSLVNQTPQNSFIKGVSDLAGDIGMLAEKGLSIYTGFINAKTAAEMAKAQKASPDFIPDARRAADIKTKTDFILYAGISVAVIGTVMLVYKMAR